MAKKENKKKTSEEEEEVSTEEVAEEKPPRPRIKPKVRTIHTVMSPRRKVKKPPTGPTQAFENLRR